VQVIRLSVELGGKNKPKANIVIAIRRVIVVAIRYAAVLRLVEVAAATHDTVRAFWRLTYFFRNYISFSMMLFG
jgi:hypothetical protein